MTGEMWIILLVLTLKTNLALSDYTDCVKFEGNLQYGYYVPANLTMECKVTKCQESQYVHVQSISIYKPEHSLTSPLSRVEQYKGVTGTVPKLTANGSVVEIEKAYLKITWETVEVNDYARYRCDVEFKTDYGSTQYVSKYTDVIKPEENCTEAKVHLEGKLSKLTATCNETVTSVNYLVGYLIKTAGYLFFPRAQTYSNHTYFLSRVPYDNDKASNEICDIIGGYLVRLNDQQELNSVVSYYKSHNASGVLISGTDVEVEGVWKYQGTKVPVKFFQKGMEKPAWQSTRKNCLVLISKGNEHVTDITCQQSATDTFPFVCEVES